MPATPLRYRPEIAAARKSLSRSTASGVVVELGVDADAGTKIAFELVGPHYLSSSLPATVGGRGGG